MNQMTYYLGMSNIMMLLEQERKHWLLNTDKKKISQDKRTGDVFNGTIDNKGFSVVAETKKTGIKYDIIKNVSFNNNELNNVLKVDIGVFPYSNSVDGLLIERILSSQYTLASGDQVHYKIKFENCKEVIIPMAGDTNSSSVYSFRWIKTNTKPTILLMDPLTGTTTSEVTCNTKNTTGATYYYPLETTLQPLPVTSQGSTYTTSAVDSDAYIGYPLYWFTCNEFTNVAKFTLTNDTTYPDRSYFALGNDTTLTNTTVNIYTGFSEVEYPSNDLSDFKVQCNAVDTFNNTNADFNAPLNSTFKLINTQTDVSYDFTLSSDCTYKLCMSRNVGWTYVNNTTYEVSLDEFENDGTDPLIAIFNITVTTSDSTSLKTTDTGAAGMAAKTTMYWSKNESNSYIEGLYEFDGLPEGLADRLNAGEGVVVYAVHDTPNATQADEKQTAALILDPGDVAAYSEDENVESEDLGRVYIISNDDIEYENNAKSEHPKPARTAARICDIPTSVVQLSNISGLAPTNVVDKKYVRSECSYDLADKERLYNTLKVKWVKPTDLDSEGNKIIDEIESEDNPFVFRSLDSLKKVDLVNHNDFRKLTNLNPMVDPDDVSVASIIEKGSGYAEGDQGIIIVGGFSFTYIVGEVNAAGGVLEVAVGPSNVGEINLSNFDMSEGTSGISSTYGSSPLTGEGTGLKIRFFIDGYADILTKKDEIFEDLFALVSDSKGLWLYTYNINASSSETPKLGFWEQSIKISDYEDSNIKIRDGYLSLTDSYINSILPTTHEIPVSLNETGKELTYVEACVTSSCINVIDKLHTPINVEGDNFSVDINKFVTDGIQETAASYKTFESILNALKAENKLTFDSYLLWRWKSTTDPANKRFEYMIIRRSFNNYVSSDETSLLPENSLRYNKYVHTNSGTTVTWNVNDIGQMVWVYNPSSTTLEKYRNVNHRVKIDYVNSTWDKIDIYNTSGTPIVIVDENLRIKWNVATNNPYQTNYDPDTTDEIYQQPEYVHLITIDANVSTINPNHNPIGSWTLVYPRSQNYYIRNNGTETNIDLVELDCVHTNSIPDVAVIRDRNGNNVNNSTFVIDHSNTIKLKVFDAQSNTWKSV